MEAPLHLGSKWDLIRHGCHRELMQENCAAQVVLEAAGTYTRKKLGCLSRETNTRKRARPKSLGIPDPAVQDRSERSIPAGKASILAQVTSHGREVREGSVQLKSAVRAAGSAAPSGLRKG